MQNINGSSNVRVNNQFQGMTDLNDVIESPLSYLYYQLPTFLEDQYAEGYADETGRSVYQITGKDLDANQIRIRIMPPEPIYAPDGEIIDMNVKFQLFAIMGSDRQLQVLQRDAANRDETAAPLKGFYSTAMSVVSLMDNGVFTQKDGTILLDYCKRMLAYGSSEEIYAAHSKEFLGLAPKQGGAVASVVFQLETRASVKEPGQYVWGIIVNSISNMQIIGVGVRQPRETVVTRGTQVTANKTRTLASAPKPKLEPTKLQARPARATAAPVRTLAAVGVTAAGDFQMGDE